MKQSEKLKRQQGLVDEIPEWPRISNTFTTKVKKGRSGEQPLSFIAWTLETLVIDVRVLIIVLRRSSAAASAAKSGRLDIGHVGIAHRFVQRGKVVGDKFSDHFGSRRDALSECIYLSQLVVRRSI
jgi:hypothetical protein